MPDALVTVTFKSFSPATRSVAPSIETDEVKSAGVATTETELVPGSRKIRPPLRTD